MKFAWMMTIAVILAVANADASLPTSEDFDAMPVGQTFLAPVNGWQADTDAITVTNEPVQSGSRSVQVKGGTLADNIGATPAGVVWTEFHIVPVLGDPPASLPTNTANHIHYFDTNGWLNVYTAAGFLRVTNDVHGNALTPVSATNFTRIGIYQNFSARNSAVLLNGVVVLQDIAFPGTSGAYQRFRVHCPEPLLSTPASLDTFSAGTTVPASVDGNSNGLSDAQELQDYGYVARTLRIGAGQAFTTLSNVLAVARDRDTLIVDNGSIFSENVTIARSLTMAGSFTNTGTITVSSGKTVAVSDGFDSSLVVSGTLAVAQSVTVRGTVISVAGDGAITLGATNAQLLAGTLVITNNGQVVSSNGRVAEVSSGVDLTGTFTLDSTWGSLTSSSLDFTEDFEPYAAGTDLASLGFHGWSAGAGVGSVVSSPVSEGARAASVEGGVVSNRLSGGTARKVWFDVWMRPVLGEMPASPASAHTMMFFVTTNGFVSYFASNEWHEVTNNAAGKPVGALSASHYARFTVFANYTNHLAALFLNGTLMVQRVSIPVTKLTCSMIGVQSGTGAVTCFDKVQVTETFPVDLTADIDSDTWPDALEIHNHDSLSVMIWPVAGSIYNFR